MRSLVPKCKVYCRGDNLGVLNQSPCISRKNKRPGAILVFSFLRNDSTKMKLYNLKEIFSEKFIIQTVVYIILTVFGAKKSIFLRETCIFIRVCLKFVRFPYSKCLKIGNSLD